MVMGVLRRQGDSYLVEVPREEVERLHLHEGEPVTFEFLPRERDDAAGAPAGRATSDQDETAYLLRSPRNRERLLKALGQAKRGEGTPMGLAEVRKELGLDEEA